MTNIQLTQELVKSLFDYKDGFLYWKISKSGIKIGDRAGWLEKKQKMPRYRIMFFGKQYLSARVIFLYHNAYLPIMVDHKDRNQLNDKIENLRDASKYENARNRTSQKNSSSKYLGVSLHCGTRWHARIWVNNKNKNLGSFEKEYMAALAYNRAAVMYHKDFANLNIITLPY